MSSFSARPEIARIREAAEAQVRRTDRSIAGTEAVHDTLLEIQDAMDHGFTELVGGLREMCFTIDVGFQELYDQLELQSEALKAIKGILERPLGTQAKELRKRAEDAYLNGWYDEAERDLLNAAERNYADFLIYQLLGNIYFYHRDEYQKALDNYQKAAKYAVPRSIEHTVRALLCLASVYHRMGRIQEAYNSTSEALGFLADDPRCLYHYSRYAAVLGKRDEFLKAFKSCIQSDPSFLICSDADSALDCVRGEVRSLVSQLRASQVKRIDQLLAEINAQRAGAVAEGVGENAELNSGLAQVRKLYDQGGYLDLLEASRLAANLFVSAPSVWVKAKYAERELLLAEQNRIKSGGNAGSALLWMLLVWGIALLLVSAMFDWMPKGKGPVKTITLSVGGGVFAQCYGGVSLGGKCYRKGTSFEVVQETPDAICIATPSNPRECYKRGVFLQLASLGNGIIDDYSNTLSGGAQMWWLVGFPLVVWVVISFMTKQIRLEKVKGRIVATQASIGRLDTLKSRSESNREESGFPP